MAVVFDYGRDDLILYVNGKLVRDDLSAGYDAPRVSNTPAVMASIGASKGSNGDIDEVFPGMIDDVRIYHRALSGGEISDLVRKTSTRPN